MSTPQPALPVHAPEAAPERSAAAAELLLNARRLVSNGNLELALTDLGRVLRHAPKGSPEYASAASDIGVIQYHARRPDLARGFLESAARYAPNSDRIQKNLADFRANHPDAAAPRVGVEDRGGPSSVGAWVQEALGTCAELVSFSGKDVVEIGGSLPASVARSLEPRSWTSVDPSATATEQPGHRVLRVGAEAIPVEANSFDLAFSCCAFEHVPDLAAVLAEAARVLRPGGVLFAQFSPIWSSATGNHVWVKEPDAPAPTLTFSDGFLPPWCQLLWEPADLAAFVEPTHGPDIAERAARNVYEYAHINRLFADDYYRIFDECPLLIERLESHGGYDEPLPETLERLQQRHPTRHGFETAGFRVILRAGC